MNYWEKVSCSRVSHIPVFISWFSIEWIKGAWPEEREYELAKLNFIEVDEIQFDVDFVHIDKGIQDFSFFMVCDILKAVTSADVLL